MITKSFDATQNLCTVTFTCRPPAQARHVSVCGDFNSWTVGAHPLTRATDGTFSAAIPLPVGNDFAFKYLADFGGWLNDDAADFYQANEYGEVNSIVTTKAGAKPVAKKASAATVVKKAPAKKTVAKEAPAAKKAPAKKTVAKKAPAKKAPGQKKVAKKAPPPDTAG